MILFQRNMMEKVNARKRWNDQQPVLSTSAQIVSKRLSVSGGGNDLPASTFYFVTFEVLEGERHELPVSGTEYGLLVEGDQGILVSQGTRYMGFERQRVPVR